MLPAAVLFGGRARGEGELGKLAPPVKVSQPRGSAGERDDVRRLLVEIRVGVRHAAGDRAPHPRRQARQTPETTPVAGRGGALRGLRVRAGLHRQPDAQERVVALELGVLDRE
jgi:hypothetical protein